ncbi:MAG: hypothetical protein KKA65_02175 [Nanoarchaeota archaeon]|nr:hypothetical protein [Nanoarchaeota archaeon]MBU4351491.1 hypothetical protein [Nanoarchaeota archaeon]MBU4456283.1 hypothetical protein [Nanoarchaeota archaeon]MCG2720133.1 hypothetical protein [Nanoarchaeota archaeon]
MNKKILIGLGSVLILTIFLIGLVSAALSDLVYYVGQEQSGKLTAQSPEAQKALEIYNVMSSGNYMGFAQSQVCKGADAKSMCDMMSTFQQYSSYTEIINNPSSYFQGMMQQQVCKENANSCSTYSQIMQAKAQASTPIETAKSYATQMATEQLRGVVPQQVSTIISYKRYLDVFQMQPKQGAATPSEPGNPAKIVEGEVDNFADEDFEVTKNQIDRGHENECRIAFNLDGTFGDIYSCETGIPADRTGWKGHDLSKILGQDAGTLLVGTKCLLERQGTGLKVTTDDANGKAATCFVTYKDNSFTDIVGGEVKKGPNNKAIRSGIFQFNDESILIYAEFQVAEESEFVFADKKYKLQKGTTVVINETDVKFGFDEVKNKKIELFSLKNGQWVSSGLVVPTSIGAVTVKALQDGRYLVTGNFEIKGNVEDVQIGPKSIASINGIEMRTTENQLRYTNCKESIRGDWLNYCKRGNDNDFYATGNGFAFKPNIPRGDYYYLKGGKMSGRFTEVKPGYFTKNTVSTGYTVGDIGNGIYVKSHNKVLSIDAPGQIELMGISGNPEDEVRKLGSDVWTRIEGEGPVPDTLKGGFLNPPSEMTISNVILYEEAEVIATETEGGMCFTKINQNNVITAAVIADITGMVTDEQRAQIDAANNPSPACNQPGETKLKTPSSTPNVIVELKGWISKDLYINGVEVTLMTFDKERKMVILKADTNYLADPWSAKLFKPNYLGPQEVATLSPEVVEYIKDQVEDEEEYIAVNKQMTEGTAITVLATGELVSNRIYVIKKGSGMTKDWYFSRTIQGAWGGCKEINENSPACPVDIFIKCVDEFDREFLSSVTEGCPSDSQTYDKWLKLQNQ